MLSIKSKNLKLNKTEMIKRLLALLLLVTVAGNSVYAQSKEKKKDGNVVAYFGLDKKEDIHEGTVVYQFDKVLFARTDENYGRSVTPSDNLAYKIFNGTLETPKLGEVAGVDPSGVEYSWSEMVANDKGEIRSREALRGHFYSSYNSTESKVMLLECAGPTMLFINGVPHEGDHYNYGYTIIPFEAEQGDNSFLFTPGRFGMLKARVVEPSKPVLITKRDILLPDLLIEESGLRWGAVRVINTTDRSLNGYKVKVTVDNQEPTITDMVSVSPVSVRKVAFQIEDRVTELNENIPLTVTILDSRDREVDSVVLNIKARSNSKHHERTFISTFDGSVQYYSVAPSTNGDAKNQAMFLSVHGASVQARNQARAYKQKDWGYVVAPTNRRPHGFAWEEWGRLDAIEVLEDAEAIFETDKAKTYLTGHSMGGHGSWYLGAIYPDRFAAVAPCAGYPELLGYAKQKADDGKVVSVGEEAVVTMLNRATNVSRTKKLIRNYEQSGIFISHGDSDHVVPTAQAQEMRELLGTFKKDMAYYEHAGGEHWFGNSVDWTPLFDYFKWHKNITPEEADHFEFYTANPGVNATNHWVTIQQQVQPFEISSIKFDVYNRSENATVTGHTSNVRTIILDLKSAKLTDVESVVIDGVTIATESKATLVLQKSGKIWSVIDDVDNSEKSPVRSGGFKSAFTNRPIFVYATRGSKAENSWYYNKARFDAETFYYRGNSSIELIKDVDFNPADFKDRNVVIYGNSENNSAWNKILKGSSIKVTNSKIIMGDRELIGDDLGCYFIQPRDGSTTASVGVVAGTGEEGMKSIYLNQYFVAGHGFPDLMVVDSSFTTDGLGGVKAAGFFGNDWSVSEGEFGWR